MIGFDDFLIGWMKGNLKWPQESFLFEWFVNWNGAWYDIWKKVFGWKIFILLLSSTANSLKIAFITLCQILLQLINGSSCSPESHSSTYHNKNHPINPFLFISLGKHFWKKSRRKYTQLFSSAWVSIKNCRYNKSIFFLRSMAL